MLHRRFGRCQSERVPYSYEYANMTEVSIQQYEYDTQDESWLRRQLGGAGEWRCKNQAVAALATRGGGSLKHYSSL
eukprot:scaffold345770_cov14-Prasinocladus_malaysianus.AAC.1